MTTRMRVATSGKKAEASDFGSNALPGRVLTVADDGSDVEWSDPNGIQFQDASIVWGDPDGLPQGLIERHFETTATELYLKIAYVTSIGINAVNEVAVVVDGVTTYLPWDGSGVVSGAYTIVTLTHPLGVGTHLVVLRDGPANCAIWPTFVSPLAYFTACTANALMTLAPPPNRPTHVVVVSDSISEGIGTTHPTTDGWVTALRDEHPEWSNSIVGGGGATLTAQFGLDATMVRFAEDINAQCVGAPNSVVIFVLGINDAISGASNAANYGTRFGLLLDACFALGLKNLIVCSPFLTAPAVEAAHGIPAFRAALAAACALRPWVNYIATETRIPVTAWAPDGVHPTDAQQTMIFESFESILDLWGNANLQAFHAYDIGPTSQLQGASVRVLPDEIPQTANLKQATLVRQPNYHSREFDGLVDGPGATPYLATTVALPANVLGAFGTVLTNCTVILVMRCDGANGVQQVLIDSSTQNQCMVRRKAAGGLEIFFGAALLNLAAAAATPVGWHVYEFTRFANAGAIYVRIDGGPEEAFPGGMGIGGPLDGFCLGSYFDFSLPANVSIASIAVIQGDPANNYRLPAVLRPRWITHCLAKWGIVVGA